MSILLRDRFKRLSALLAAVACLASAPAIAAPPVDDDFTAAEFAATLARSPEQATRALRIVYHALVWANANLQLHEKPPLFCHNGPQLTADETVKLYLGYIAEAPWIAKQPVPVAIPLISALQERYPCPAAP